VWVGVPDDNLISRDPPDTGMCFRGGEDTALDPATGASVRFFPKRTLGGTTHAAYLAHPPYRKGKGYTFWERTVTVPANSDLRFFTGMGEKAPSRSDGVVFQVFASTPGGEREKLLEAMQVKSEWIERSVPLDGFAGQRVRLRFVCDCGPKDNTTTDHSHWGDVRVVVRGTEATRTEPVRFMTWCGERSFAAGFYFDSVRSPALDIEFEIEGPEPVWITTLTAHASPDAIYREFERGMVVANPSPRAYEFDLARRVPGKRFRRLRGSSRQDPRTNNGEPIGGRVTLGGKDGLFLVKTD